MTRGTYDEKQPDKDELMPESIRLYEEPVDGFPSLEPWEPNEDERDAVELLNMYRTMLDTSIEAEWERAEATLASSGVGGVDDEPVKEQADDDDVVVLHDQQNIEQNEDEQHHVDDAHNDDPDDDESHVVNVGSTLVFSARFSIRMYGSRR